MFDSALGPAAVDWEVGGLAGPLADFFSTLASLGFDSVAIVAPVWPAEAQVCTCTGIAMVRISWRQNGKRWNEASAYE